MTLASKQVENYRTDGFLLVRDLIPRDEAGRLREEAHGVINRLAQHHDAEATWSTAEGLADGPTALHHCHDAQYHSAAFTRLLTDPRVLEPASELMGTSHIAMHHNKLFIKPPGNGSPFPLHQDWPFFPHERNSCMAVIIHLDDASPEKGCLRVVAGSHHGGRLEHVGPTDFHLPAQLFSEPDVRLAPANAGDALFFSCLTVHGSGPNLSDEARTTWLLQMRAADDRQTVDRHNSPGGGMMLSGINTGDIPPPSSL